MELNIELMLKSEEKRMPFLKELYEFTVVISPVSPLS